MARRELQLGVIFTGRVDEAFRAALKNVQDLLGQFADTSKKLEKTIEGQTSGIGKLGKGLRGYTRDVEKFLAIQARWYGAKAILFAAVELPGAAAKSVVAYTAEIDQARAEMLRWGATSGAITKEMVENTDEIIRQIRRATTEYPVLFKDLSQSVQAFIGAGMEYDFVAKIVPDIAKLRTAFKEINVDQFAVALTGAFKTFRGQITGAKDDVDAFRILIDQMMKAQAVGIIRPEQFTKVLQYLGPISKLVGFTTEQMFAMSVAITDSGMAANNAARLAGGFMLSLTQPKALKAMKELAVDIDKDISLGKNFKSIMDDLYKRMGSMGGISVKGLGFLQTLTSADRLKAFVTFIMQYEKFLTLTEQIKGAVGGLTAAADIMKLPMPAQWIIFKNVLLEIGKVTTENITPGLKELLGITVDIARGILYAADTTGLYSDKLGSLGSHGQTAYEMTAKFKKALEDAWPVIKAIISILGELGTAFAKGTLWLAEHAKLIEFLVYLLTGRLLVAFANSVLGIGGLITAFKAWQVSGAAVTGVLGTIFGLVSKHKGIFAALGIAVGGATFAFEGFGGVLMNLAMVIIPLFLAKIGPVGWAIAAIATAATLISTLGPTIRDFATDLAKAELEMKNMTLEQLQTQASTLQKIYDEKKAAYDEQMNLDKNMRNEEVIKEEAHYKALLLLNKKYLDLASKANAPEPKEQKGTNEWPGTVDKGSKKIADRNLQFIKARANADLAILKAQQAFMLAELEVAKRQGLVSEQAISDARLNSLKMIYEQEMAVLKLEEDELKANERIALANTKNAADEKIKYGIERERIRQKKEVLGIQYNQNSAVERGRRTEEEINHQLKMQEYARDRNLALIKESLKEQSFMVDQTLKEYEDLYSKGYILAEEYYSKIPQLIQRQRQLDIESARTDYASKLADIDDEIQNKTVAGSEKWKELQAKKAQLMYEYTGKIYDIEKAAAGKSIDLWRKKRDDIEAIFKDKGVFGVLATSLKDVGAQFNKEGLAWYNLFKGIAQGMYDAFDEFFFDALKGQFKSFSDYWDNFLNAMLRSMSQFMASQAMQFIFGGNKQGTGMNLFGGGGMFGGLMELAAFGASSAFGMSSGMFFHKGTGNKTIGQTKAPKHLVPSYLFENAPRAHEGLIGKLAHDEVPIIAKKDESVLTPEQMAERGSLYMPMTFNIGERNKSIKAQIQREVPKLVEQIVKRNM